MVFGFSGVKGLRANFVSRTQAQRLHEDFLENDQTINKLVKMKIQSRKANASQVNRNFQRGASAVEMALLLPLLVLMLDGVLEFGLMLHNKSVLISATNVAARAGIAKATTKLTTAEIAAIVSNYCTDGLISIGATNPPTVTVIQSQAPTYPNPLQVSVSYTFKGLLATFQTNPVLGATTVMYNE